MNRAICLSVLIAIGSVSLAAVELMQPKERARVAAIEKVRDNLYIIRNSDPRDPKAFTGGNIAVLVTEKGVVLVDTKLPGYGQAILEQVRSVTDKPVTIVINTHTHFDHSGSNTEFPASVEFVAHENTRANMARATCAPVTNCDAFKGEKAAFLPKRTFKDTMSLLNGKDRIDLYYFGRGHTSGDTWVVFPALRTMHTGDMFQFKNMPFVDAENSGGNAREFSQTLAHAASRIRNVDTVITGHLNTVLTWRDFTDYADFYADFLTKVREGIKAGRSAQEIAAAYRRPDKYGDYDVDPKLVLANVQGIYGELKK